MKLMIDIDLYGAAYHAEGKPVGAMIATILRNLAHVVESKTLDDLPSLDRPIEASDGKRIGQISVDSE